MKTKDKMKLPLSEINKLEKRIGPRIWDGVFFNRDGITNPTLTILNNKIGREIREVLKLNDEQ